jgi:hypothetical protein
MRKFKCWGKQIFGKNQIWDKCRFTFSKGSSFWVWWVRPFSCMIYHLASRPGEVDEDALSTFRHTFFVLLLFVGMVGGSSGWGSCSP